MEVVIFASDLNIENEGGKMTGGLDLPPKGGSHTIFTGIFRLKRRKPQELHVSQQSAMNNQQSTINNQQSTISNQQSAINNEPLQHSSFSIHHFQNLIPNDILIVLGVV
jgi:hypothetical protein